MHADRSVHPDTDVVGDRLVQGVFWFGQLEVQRVCVALREEAAPIKRRQVFFHEPTHHIADIGHFAVTEPTGEPFRIDEGHEGKEIFVLAVVRCRRQQQKMPGTFAKHLSEKESLRLLQLVAVLVS